MGNKEKSYIKILEDAQKRNPNIVLPSMGILNNETKVNVNGKDYIRKDKSVKE